MSATKETEWQRRQRRTRERDAHVAEHGPACQICGNVPKRGLDADHDHKGDGRTRGWLDHRCNRNLPAWVTLAWLDSAYRYLVRHELSEAGRIIYREEDRGFESPCWVWQRAFHSAGYGVVRVRGELLYVHRLMYEGLIQDAEHVHHRCGVRACINPAHLSSLTAVEHSHAHERTPDTCKHGHPWTPANTYRRPDGSGRRQCRECIKRRSNKQAAIRKARRAEDRP